jgi:F-type H+-transporting ATPase subunit gamma
MSLSRELQLHIGQLKEISSILNSMKNLAFMEIHKLQSFKTMQGKVVANIECAAQDFLKFYPDFAATEDNAAHICILLGAERGFCGDFNESLINAIAGITYAGVIAIGSRLCNKMEGMGLESLTMLEGANIAEDVPSVINRLVNSISSSPDSMAATEATTLKLTVVYHDNSTNQVSHRQVLPPFPQQIGPAVHYGNPPELNLEPGVFFADLTDHYLFAILHEIFYNSLMSENHSRLQHLEGAVNHLDEETVKMQRKAQIYRQEEITEEIEVILLNTENL